MLGGSSSLLRLSGCGLGVLSGVWVASLLLAWSESGIFTGELGQKQDSTCVDFIGIRDEPTNSPSFEITTAAVHRATGTSLGSICLGAGIVAVLRLVGRTAAEAKHITSPRSKLLPTPFTFLTNLTPIFAIVAGVLDQLNGYALVYVGITGEAFWPSARRAVGLAKGRKGGRLLDCEPLENWPRSIRLMHCRHSHKTPSYVELDSDGSIYRHCRVPIHDAFCW